MEDASDTCVVGVFVQESWNADLDCVADDSLGGPRVLLHGLREIVEARGCTPRTLNIDGKEWRRVTALP